MLLVVVGPVVGDQSVLAGTYRSATAVVVAPDDGHEDELRFTTIHFYDPCRVGLSTPDLWCITVATQASFLFLVRF